METKLWRPPGYGPDKVQISCGGVPIVSVGQRDLYRKYGWPAKQTIIDHLNLSKEQLDE